MSQQLLRRAWDALDTFRQAYPENWHDEDQQLMDDLLKADLDLSGVKREWVWLTDVEIADIEDEELTLINTETFSFAKAIEAKLKEKNGG